MRKQAEAWKKDPLLRIEQRLKADGALTDAAISEHRHAMLMRIEAAIRFCETSPLPDPASLRDDLFAP